MKKQVILVNSLLVLLFVYLFVLQLQAIWPFTVDDMYIPLRYAKHWASGAGLLWNVQDPPVEGYSNFSFVVLGALSILLHGNPVVVLKAAGVVGLFFTVFYLHRLSKYWFSGRQALLPCIALLFYKGQILWSSSGLETTVYEAALVSGVYYLFMGMGYRFFPYTRREAQLTAMVVAGVLFAFASLTRPEAPVLVAVFFLLLCWDKPLEGVKKYRVGLACFALAFGLLYLPYFTWRWYYYGYLFSNPIYCKGYAPGFFSLIDRQYLQFIWPFAILSVFAYWGSKDKRYYFLWLPSVVYLILLALSDPVVAYFNRLFLPAFALLLPLAVQGLDTLLYRYFQHRDLNYWCAFYFAVFVFAWFFIPAMSLAQYRYYTVHPQDSDRGRLEIVQWLTQHGRPTDLVALGDSGLIPYSSSLAFMDTYCLNSKVMGHYPAKERYALYCQDVLHAKPRFIILMSLTAEGKTHYAPTDACLKPLMEVNQYTLVKQYSVTEPKSVYHYELFTRNEARF